MVTYKELKSKGKAQLGNPKSGHGCLQGRPLARAFKSQFKQGFTKVVVTRAGLLPEWLQGELRLY